MLMQNAPGVGNTIGDQYQIWLGISIIKDWIIKRKHLNENNDLWLKEEFNEEQAGIFNDIVTYENGNYNFYQVKHTINMRGDLIGFDNLHNIEDKLSIERLYASYRKIKEYCGDKPFRLIIYSNKCADREFKKRLENLQFIDTILNANKNARTYNKGVIDKFLELCNCNYEELSQFLHHLYFILRQNNFEGLQSKTLLVLANNNLVRHLFDLVIKSHQKKEFYISLNEINYYVKLFPPAHFPFTTPEDFFKPDLNDRKIFNHLNPLVGRSDIIEDLYGFFKSNKTIALLRGSGGMGKSKILYEISKEFESKCPNWELYFLKKGVKLTSDVFEYIPLKNILLIIDDAHLREDELSVLLPNLPYHKNHIKLILSYRSMKEDIIQNLLVRYGFDDEEIENDLNVKKLEKEKAEELALTILGENLREIIESFVKKANFNPLFITIGGKLVREKKVYFDLLQQDEEFQTLVLNRFQEELMSKIESSQQQIYKNMLSLISILSTIRLDKQIKDILSSFLNIESYYIYDIIEILEQNGILFFQQDLIRIIPEFLSDHVLYNACFTSHGQNKGYELKVFDHFSKFFFRNILLNLSKLDWRVRLKGNVSNLMNDIWSRIFSHFKNSSHVDRTTILSSLKDVGYFQPENTLKIIEFAIENPSEVPEPNGGIYNFSHKDVINEIPPILKDISYHKKYFTRCCNILWKLGRNEKERAFYPTESSMDILLDLAKYDIDREIKFYELILDCVENWLKESDAFEHENSPILVLSPLLSREGRNIRGISGGVRVTPFFVSFEKTQHIRERVISILKNFLEGNNKKAIQSSIQILLNALYPPRGEPVSQVTEDILAIWLPEQVEILKIISKFFQQTDNPIILMYLEKELRRLYDYPEIMDTIKQGIKKLIKEFSETPEIQLNRAISFYFRQNWKSESDEEFRGRTNKMVEKAVKEFIQRRDDIENPFFFINEKLNDFKIFDIDVNPAPFLQTLGNNNSELGFEICQKIIQTPSNNLSPFINSLIAGIREVNVIKSREIIKTAIESNNEELVSSIAHGYLRHGWTVNMKQEDLSNIKRLINSSDNNVKQLAMKSLSRFPEQFQENAIQIILDTDIGYDDNLANAICEVIMFKYGVYVEDLSEENLKTLLNNFLTIKEIKADNYYLKNFLEYCTLIIPQDLVNFFIKRIELLDDESFISSIIFSPIPYSEHFKTIGENLSRIENYKDIIRIIRDFGEKVKPEHKRSISNLFIISSNNLSPESLEVLEEWFDTNDCNKMIIIAHFLENAGLEIIFGHYKFMSKLLEASYNIEIVCYERVSRIFHSSAFLGLTIGRRSSKDEYIRDKSLEIAQIFEKDTPTYHFYKKLTEIAEDEMERSKLNEDEFGF